MSEEHLSGLPTPSTSHVSRLNTIIKRTGAVVVVSSMWRLGRSRSELQAILDCKGFKGQIVGVTPDKGIGTPRRDEIMDVVARLGGLLVSFVAIDDDEDADVEGHFVQTSFEVGLSEMDVSKAVQILGVVT